MKLELEGRNVVVTGGSRGIGRAIAERFTAEGASCLICGRDEDALEDAAGAIGCAAVAADVTNADGIAALAAAADEAFGGGPDILVCNVGNGRSVPPGSESDAEWRRVFDVNLFSATAVIEAFLPRLKAGGAIGCISSVAGRRVVGAPVAYAAAKAALDATIANLAPPLGRNGIRIFGLAPGNTMFDGSVWETISREKPDEVEAMLRDRVPLGRFASAEEIADAFVFLASPRASFVTGTVHVVDGGQSGGG